MSEQGTETKRGARRIGHAPFRAGSELVGDCLFVSDIHLFEPHDANTALFVELLESIAEGDGARSRAVSGSGRWHGADLGGVRHVFLVGDVFEFIDGSVSYFRSLWEVVFDALAELQRRGISVYFIEGNHDFGFASEAALKGAGATGHTGEPRPWSGQWATFAGDAGLHFTHRGRGTLHVRHGDDVVSEPGYLYFRAFVKSRWAGRILRMLPAAPAHRFFLAFARLSRKAGSGYSLTLEKIHSDVRAFLKHHPEIVSGGTMVIGHIHVHLDTVVGGVRIFAGPDWHTAPSCLVIRSSGEAQRYFVDPRRTVPLLGS